MFKLCVHSACIMRSFYSRCTCNLLAFDCIVRAVCLYFACILIALCLYDVFSLLAFCLYGACMLLVFCMHSVIWCCLHLDCMMFVFCLQYAFYSAWALNHRFLWTTWCHRHHTLDLGTVNRKSRTVRPLPRFTWYWSFVLVCPSVCVFVRISVAISLQSHLLSVCIVLAL